VAAQDVDIDHVLVGTLMTPKPESLHVDDELVYALNQMSLGGYRHIPLLDDQGRPTRVVSERGIVEGVVNLFVLISSRGNRRTRADQPRTTAALKQPSP